jgi:hypothetical protein
MDTRHEETPGSRSFAISTCSTGSVCIISRPAHSGVTQGIERQSKNITIQAREEAKERLEVKGYGQVNEASLSHQNPFVF